MATTRCREDEPLGHQRSARDLPQQPDLDRRNCLICARSTSATGPGKPYDPQLATLGRSEGRLAAARLELLDDVQRVQAKVDRVHRDAQDLALPEATAAAQVGRRLVSVGHVRAHREKPLRRPRRDAFRVRSRRPYRAGSARAPRKVPVARCCLKAARTLAQIVRAYEPGTPFARSCWPAGTNRADACRGTKTHAAGTATPPGPSKVAQQHPVTTDGAHSPATDQRLHLRKPWSVTSPVRPTARRSGSRDHISHLRIWQWWEAFLTGCVRSEPSARFESTLKSGWTMSCP